MTMCDRPLVVMVNMGDIYSNVILHAQINILWSFSHQRVADGSEGLSTWGLEIGKCYSRAVFCHNFLKNSPNVHLHSPHTCARSSRSFSRSCIHYIWHTLWQIYFNATLCWESGIIQAAAWPAWPPFLSGSSAHLDLVVYLQLRGDAKWICSHFLRCVFWGQVIKQHGRVP